MQDSDCQCFHVLCANPEASKLASLRCFETARFRNVATGPFAALGVARGLFRQYQTRSCHFQGEQSPGAPAAQWLGCSYDLRLENDNFSAIS